MYKLALAFHYVSLQYPFTSSSIRQNKLTMFVTVFNKAGALYKTQYDPNFYIRHQKFIKTNMLYVKLLNHWTDRLEVPSKLMLVENVWRCVKASAKCNLPLGLQPKSSPTSTLGLILVFLKCSLTPNKIFSVCTKIAPDVEVAQIPVGRCSCCMWTGLRLWNCVKAIFSQSTHKCGQSSSRRGVCCFRMWSQPSIPNSLSLYVCFFQNFLVASSTDWQGVPDKWP